MSHQPLLAVIVPVYKVEDYLRLCVDSILSQSYSNLRIILVDDGSPDGCGAICDAYAEQDPRVLSVHKENGGLSSARNFGLQYTEGCEYIAFVDSDDSIEPDIYEAAISYLEAHADVDIVGYGINEIRADGKFYCGEKEGRLFTREEALAELVQGFSFKVGPSAWSKVYRASAIGTIRFREGYVYEDNSFSLEVFSKINSYYLLPKGGYNYLLYREGAITSGFDTRMACLFDNIEDLQRRHADDATLCLYANTMVVNYLWMYWYQLYGAFVHKGQEAKYREITSAFLPYLKRARRRPFINVIGTRVHSLKTWLFLHAPYTYTRINLR